MRALVIGLLLAPAAVYAQTDAARATGLELLEECAETVDPAVVGLLALEEECPGLSSVLDSSMYAPFVSSAQRESLTGDGLLDLHELIVREQRAAAQAAPDPKDLPAILASLREDATAERPLTWFERVKRWLRERLASSEVRNSWLTRWLEQLQVNTSLMDAIVVVSIVLVILLALGILANELRVAGVFRRRGGGSEVQPKGATLIDARGLTWSDFDGLPPAERPSFVLRMLVAALVSSGRLKAERSLTHREITARAALDDDAQRASLASVAMLAERVVYGGGAPGPDADAVLTAGRTLHARLSGERK